MGERECVQCKQDDRMRDIEGERGMSSAASVPRPREILPAVLLSFPVFSFSQRFFPSVELSSLSLLKK